MFSILVVEDDKALCKTVCSFLNQNGYRAVGCLHAREAYDAMYDTIFDLIVSDIMMPDIDGFEFARSVRELDKDIPILFMTARDDLASKQQGQADRADRAASAHRCAVAPFQNCVVAPFGDRLVCHGRRRTYGVS